MMTLLRKHKTLYCELLVCSFLLLSGVAQAGRNEILSEIRLTGATGADKNAGVWVDGLYLGFVNELKGTKKVLLVPGEHSLTFRQTGYRDLTRKVVIGPGQKENYVVSMEPDPQAQYPTEPAKVKISVWPSRAAVFVDDRFVGHVAEFDGIGKSMLLSPGKHRFKITLPGWQSFETEANLWANQRFELKTALVPEDIREARPPIKEQSEAGSGSTPLSAGKVNP